MCPGSGIRVISWFVGHFDRMGTCPLCNKTLKLHFNQTLPDHDGT